MHELSIALELVELASAEARRHGDIRVVAVHVRVGPLAGVVDDALRFSFDRAAAGTILDGARLDITTSEPVGMCATCGERRVIADIRHRRCPLCTSPIAELLSGDELVLTALEIADRAPTNC